MIIQNFKQLAHNGLRKDALIIIEAAFSAVIPEKAIANRVRLEGSTLRINRNQYDLDAHDRIFVVGFGKSSSHMAKALEAILGDRIAGGVVISTKDAHLKKIAFYQGTHPFVSRQNLEATKKLVAVVQGASKRDLIFCLISGGGSALLFYPNIPYDAYLKKIAEIFNSGLDIFELNRIRKKLSRVKDGRLAQMTRATLVSLIFSDVIGDDLGTIASGPTYSPDGFDHVRNHLLLTNTVALNAMETAAKQLSYTPRVLTNRLGGEARLVHRDLLSRCSPGSDCWLFAGETVVKVTGDGVGGRNQEFCLAAIEAIEGDDDCVIISAGTDGIDGPGHGAAGAVVSNDSLKKARVLNLDYRIFLENNDAYHFFKKMNDLIITGITGSNVADVGVILKPVLNTG